MANDDLFDKLGDFISKSTQNLRDRLTMDVTDLLRAVDKNDPDDVERALAARVDTNATDGIRRRALPMATDNNNLEIVKLLLKAGADPNLPGPYGDPPLYKAVYWENEEIALALLAAGADIHQPGSSGKGPLEEARTMGYQSMVELLENYHLMAREKQIETDLATHQAMKEKAEAARQRRAREAAEKQAAELRAKEEALTKARAAAEAAASKKYQVEDGNYPKALVEAIFADDTENAKVLLAKTTALDAFVPEFSTTPLLAAIEKKNNIITNLLIERGADTLSIVPAKQHSPLSMAVGLNAYKLVRLILDKNGELAALALNNPELLLSPQFIAYKDPRMFNLLLAAGANPYYGGQHGQAPVVKAIEKGSLAVLPVLVANQVDLNYRYENQTPLEWAIQYRREDWVSALLDEEVNPDTQDANGNTPLMLAVELNFTAAVALLLEADAELSLTDHHGRTAVDLAQELGGREIILEIIRER